jgi:hypothetical protein
MIHMDMIFSSKISLVQSLTTKVLIPYETF